MSINPNALLIEQVKVVTGVSPVTPAGTTPDYVSLKGCTRCCVLISVRNATTVTGSAITLLQAQDVSGANNKALAFTTAYRCLNTGTGGTTDAFAAFAVSGNTFTTDSTNSQEHLYAIEVQNTDLDVANNFDCL